MNEKEAWAGDFSAVAQIMKQLSDEVRVRIFWILCHEELGVLELAGLMKMSPPAVSHHLKVLRQADLISARRDGRQVYYSSKDRPVAHFLQSMIENLLSLSDTES